MFTGKRDRPRRRWWQRLLRLGAAALLAAAGAYVTLPYWLPTEIIKAHLANQMAEQMGVDVGIGSMSVSWSRGVELHQLEISAPGGAQTKPMVQVQCIRAEFSPLAYFLQNRIGWMELDSPRVFAEVDEAGTVNLSVLSKMQFRAAADRIGVRQADATIRLPGHDELLHVCVHNAEYVAGRLQELGRITVSATLDQQDSLASVSMRMADGDTASAPARALFNFAELDLAQLPLAQLLGLPLAELGGQCRGSLDLQLNRYGVVDQFALNVSVTDLQVRPTNSPRLPVIPEAGLSISAVYDPIAGDLDAGLLEVQSAHVRLPGLDLRGRGSLSTDVLRGRWEAIRDLEVEGDIHPDTLATLLLGHPEIPGPVQTRGPISLKFTARRDRTLFHTGGFIRGDRAEFWLAGSPIKPVGTPLQLAFKGRLDKRTWRLELDPDSSSLLIGANRLAGGGAITDVRRLLDDVPVEPLPEAAAALLGRLGLVDWESTFQIRELESLAFIVDEIAKSTGPITLDGELSGKLTVKQLSSTQFSLSMEASTGTSFSVGNFVAVRAARARAGADGAMPAALTCSAIITRDEPLLAKEFRLTWSSGGGGVSIGNGTLRLARSGNARSLELAATGDFKAMELDCLAQSMPMLTPQGSDTLAGSLTGQYSVVIGKDHQRASLRADFRQAGIRFGRLLTKDVGQQADMEVALTRWQNESGLWNDEASAAASIPGVDVYLIATIPRKRASDDAVSWQLRADITDAAKLAPTIPQIGDLFAPGCLAGEAKIRAAGTWRKGRLAGNVEVDATPLVFATAGTQARVKRAEVPMTLSLAGRAVSDEETATLQIDDTTVRLGSTSVQLAGKATVSRRPPDDASESFLPVALDRIGFQALFSTDLSRESMEFSPELAAMSERYCLSGFVDGRSDVTLRSGQLSVISHFDLTRLAAGQVGSFALPQAWSNDDEPGCFTKPTGMPATVDIELTAPQDLRYVRINSMHLRLADATVLADGLVELRAEEPIKGTAHIAVSIPRAEILSSIAPWLEPHGPRGDAYAELQVSASAEGITISSARLKSNGLCGGTGGKEIAVTGEVSTGSMHINPGHHFSLDSFRTDNLKVQLGQSQLWLTANLENLQHAARGTFQVIASKLDLDELAALLSAPNEHGDRDLGDTDQSPIRTAKPSTEERRRLAEESGQTVRRLKEVLAATEVRGRVAVDHLRTYDPSVRQYYDVDQLQLSLELGQGDMVCRYVAGLNGGTIRGNYSVCIDDTDPVVTWESAMQNVIATESIQPQLAEYFPGNTVGGLFTRSERSRAPLRNLIANMKDYRFPLQQTGQATTVTTDGLVEGRAAPRFVTRIFPGLNLAKYKYDKMTAFATFRPDGVAENDMVFSGPIYDIYIQGETDAGNIGRYQIGLILLGSPQSPEWNHRYKQGRVPILKLKARIEGGKMHDEEVSYPWPSESLFVIFLQNNIFYRVWLAAANK